MYHPDGYVIISTGLVGIKWHHFNNIIFLNLERNLNVCCTSLIPGIVLSLHNGGTMEQKKLLMWFVFILKFETGLLFTKSGEMNGIFYYYLFWNWPVCLQYYLTLKLWFLWQYSFLLAITWENITSQLGEGNLTFLLCGRDQP